MWTKNIYDETMTRVAKHGMQQTSFLSVNASIGYFVGIYIMISSLNLPTLKYRRLRGYMIEVFNITHNILRQNSIT